MIRECRSCGKIYKTEYWFKKHVKDKQHCPVANVYYRQKNIDYSEIADILYQRLLPLLESPKRKPQKMVSVKTTQEFEIPVEEFNSVRGGRADYSAVMKELKSKIDARELELIKEV